MPLLLPKSSVKNLFYEGFQKLIHTLSQSVSKVRFPHEAILYLTEDELRVAVMTFNVSKAKEITQLANFPLEGGLEAGEGLLEKLKKVFSQIKISEIPLVAAIPSYCAITRNIEIPSQNSQEIREIVNLQAGRHTPYSRTEIVVDYLNLGVFKSIYSKILLTIVHRSVIKRYLDLAERLNLRIHRFVFGPEAVARIVAKHVLLEPEKAPTIFIHIDTAFSDFLVVFKGMPLFIRNIPMGAQMLALDREVNLSRFAEELKKSIEAYESEKIDQKPTMLVLVGALGGLGLGSETLEPLIGETLHIPTKIWDYEKAWSLSESAKACSEDPKPSFLGAIASAFTWEELVMEMVPEENRLRRTLEERAKEIVKTGMFSMICLCLAGAIFLSQLYFRKAQASFLTRRYEPIKKEAATLEEDHARIQAVRLQLAARGKSLESLVELYKLLPPDISLIEINFDEAAKFSIKGTSLSRPSIFALVGGMEASSLFRSVQTKYVMGRTEEGKELSDFEIGSSFE